MSTMAETGGTPSPLSDWLEEDLAELEAYGCPCSCKAPEETGTRHGYTCPWHRAMQSLRRGVARLTAENERLRAERDEMIEWIGIVRGELILAGGEPGDRAVALHNLRSLIHAHSHFRAKISELLARSDEQEHATSTMLEVLKDAIARAEAAEARAARAERALEEAPVPIAERYWREENAHRRALTERGADHEH